MTPNFNPDLRDLMNMLGSTDQGYSSGQRYAQSIAGGQNIPNMIAPGVSYSAARDGYRAGPEGYTQADLQYYNPGPAPVMPSAPTQGNPLTIENQMPFAPAGVTTPERYTPMITNAESLKNLSDLFNANMPSGTQVSFDPFIDGEPMAIDDLMPSVSSSPIDFSFNPFEEIAPVVEPMVEDLPSAGSSPIDFSFNPFIDNLPYAPVEIDPIPEPVDVPVNPMPSYFVPETPVVSLQDLPTTPVGMPFIPNDPPMPSVSMQDYNNEQLIKELLDPTFISSPIQNFGGYDNVRGFLR